MIVAKADSEDSSQGKKECLEKGCGEEENAGDRASLGILTEAGH